MFGKDNPSIEQQIHETSSFFSAPAEKQEVIIKGAVGTAIPACPPEAFITGELINKSRFAVTFRAVHKKTGNVVLRKDVLIRVKGMREFDRQLRLSMGTKFVGRVYCVNSRASDHYFHRAVEKPEEWPKELREGSGIPGSLPLAYKHPIPPDLRPVSIFMEYFGKGDLQSIVSKWEGVISPLRNLLRTQWLAEIYAGIKRVHELGYILFDIKPENIAVASDGHARLIDFGLSLPYRSGGILLNKPRGTANYRAPEVRSTVGPNGEVSYIPRPVDYAADYYSYGILLYAMFEGTGGIRRNMKNAHFSLRSPSFVKEAVLGLTDDNPKLRTVYWNALKFYFPFFSSIDWNAIDERGGPRQGFKPNLVAK